ncbi:putative bifunctional diguanylate cyclase/phosphodiesterase [Roseateles saccharophilus]|uniref:PAS domain S-box-containing protein/diguanylate cyclase (GGDEF)-like protein n=1 Tax=Roseateles saccharophilus TaxID=304 RepID=A0A4R3U8J6_ROSSA|nr:EAL domain-containing protein [Roseateles saccharophilus]MDG0836074.1 EAL domain-containing protein [Roseateles saccharophilus]TCU82735.1 PAS domain S-box-containing protein/diguanylate cyclase (GGDEF)-like protein [Roseateles saccharophilus]
MSPDATLARPIVLVVDDSPEILRVLGELLSSRYQVQVANGGQRALDMLERGDRPDLILLDVLMPEIDGYAVLLQMQNRREWHDIPVIFLTAMGGTEDEERGLDLGAVDYIAKPVRPAIVLARVQAQIDLKRARDLLRNQNAVLEEEITRRAAENELILTAAGEGIFGIDMAGRVSFINPAAAQLLGYERSALLGRAANFTARHDRQAGGNFPPAECPIHAAMTSGVPYRTARDTFWRRDGKPLPVEYTAMPVRRGELRVGVVVCFADISDRLRYQEQLERRSNYDDLTGLPNRNLLNDRIAQATARCRRDGCEVALLLVSLNRFKDINDSLGRNCGDELLRQVAQRLASNLRTGDTLARLDGDEFALLGCYEGRDGLRLPQQVIDGFACAYEHAGHEVFLSVSVGVAVFPRDGCDPDELLRNASAAAYRAKTAGGGTFCFYSTDMNARSIERLEMAAALRHAVERGELLLHYQPQLSLRTGKLIGAEALVRWLRPGHGLVPPSEFIPLAEELGIIAGIGEWVLREACRQNQAWRAQGLPALTVAVNLSVRQFETQDVVSMAGQALRDSGLPPEALELELTESAVMADAEAFVHSTERLKSLGVTVSLDDFGTGFSSLCHLQRLALDRLKIDQSFVAKAASHPDSAVIAQTIISLGHSLKLAVIAEGVENAEQLELLRDWGCDEIQGYFLSRPVPAKDLALMLAKQGPVLIGLTEVASIPDVLDELTARSATDGIQSCASWSSAASPSCV